MVTLERADVHGLRIAYRRAGSGPPLMLLHGGLGDSRDWEPQLEGLSDEFTVVAWDAPGAGQSDDPPEGVDGRAFADALAGLVEVLGLGRPHLLGLSAGSGFALELWRWHRELPASLLLASAYAGWVGSLGAEEASRRKAQVLADADQPPDRWLPGWLATLFTPQTPQHVVDRAARTMSEARPAGTRAMVRAFGDADYRDDLRTVTVPTLLLYGEQDVRAPLRVARAMHELVPHARLVVLPGVGHMTNIEAPEAFNDAVRAFLRGLTGGGIP